MEQFSSEFYFSAFNKLKKAYKTFAAQKFAEYNFSPNEIEVLSMARKKTCATEIAKEFDVSKTLVSRSVSYLEEKGMLVTEKSEVDKREQVLKLTEKGEEIVSEIDKMKQEFFDKTFRHFEEREKQVLRALLMMLMKNIFDN